MNRLALAVDPLERTPPSVDREVKKSADPVLVSLSDVHLSFGAAPVLNGINLSVRRGEAVSIIGPSGSGKSTILRCINGLIAPQHGEIRVDEIDVRAQHTDAKKIALRKRIGFVFQQYNLFPHLSVLANLTIAPVSVLGRSRAEALPATRARRRPPRIAQTLTQQRGTCSRHSLNEITP
jgi:polar amino acid transport system ATP-binding protein